MTSFAAAPSFTPAVVGHGRTAEIAAWPLVAVLMAAPLAFGAVQPWAWAGMGSAIVLLALAWAVERARAGSLKLPWSPLFISLLVALALALAQLLAGLTLDAAATHESAIKLAVYALVFFLALQYFSAASARLWRRTALAVTIYAFALALFAILQFFSSPGLLYGIIKPRWGGYIFGPYVSHNHYAGLMEMLIPDVEGLAHAQHEWPYLRELQRIPYRFAPGLKPDPASHESLSGKLDRNSSAQPEGADSRLPAFAGPADLPRLCRGGGG
jgi:hypothetical protein